MKCQVMSFESVSAGAGDRKFENEKNKSGGVELERNEFPRSEVTCSHFCLTLPAAMA